ncbi:MAG: hypothetical protein JSV62_05685 [Promethearchaeota archaeon]|nr:MAG: hypothetical protein JSV62_05685 [Candidatus Lokiarchaeota archaeon]
MMSKIELKIDFQIVECPFIESCMLPKIRFLCKIPNCKNCPDYISKLVKIR